MLNRAVGEERYESVRIYRRIWAAKVYYLRRQWMYRLFINAPDAAALFGIYPLIDSSHGYGSSSTSHQTQLPMKCIVTSKKTLSIVMGLSVCGSCSSVEST